MDEMMTFPKTVEEFMEQYKVVDTKHIYSNGTEYVPIFRMKQWFEHQKSLDLLREEFCKEEREMNHICQFVCAYRTPSGYCGSTGGYATCQRRKMDEPPTIKSAEPMTNADKYFRHATDEEIASRLMMCSCPGSRYRGDYDCYGFDGDCTACWLDWLKQEVESDA